MEKIIAHEDGHFLQTVSGKPFFWLADTAWELLNQLTYEEVEKYFKIRKEQGFNVFQIIILPTRDCLTLPNANGHLPFCGMDPLRPNEFYFRFLDRVIELAESLELYIGLLPTWGDKVNGELWGVGPVIFDNEEVAFKYGKYLGERYKKFNNILWISGGDRRADKDYHRAIWSAMAEGVNAGTNNKEFFSFHPENPYSSSDFMHKYDWLTMNMIQSGHTFLDAPIWEKIASDYNKIPAKPTLDGESNYEFIQVDPFTRKWLPEYGRYTDYDIRKQAYRSVFAGGCGITYGHAAIWQFFSQSNHQYQGEPLYLLSVDWEEGLFAKGANELKYLKDLLLNRDYFSRVPAEDLIVSYSNPLEEIVDEHYDYRRAAKVVATYSQQEQYLLVYLPLSSQKVELDLSKFTASLEAKWFDPRNGKYYEIGNVNNEICNFTTPISGPDWVLVISKKSDK